MAESCITSSKKVVNYFDKEESAVSLAHNMSGVFSK